MNQCLQIKKIYWIDIRSFIYMIIVMILQDHFHRNVFREVSFSYAFNKEWMNRVRGMDGWKEGRKTCSNGRKVRELKEGMT